VWYGAIATQRLYFVFKVSLTGSTALYTKCSSSGRPHQLWKHETGYSHDSLLFEERNPRCVYHIPSESPPVSLPPSYILFPRATLFHLSSVSLLINRLHLGVLCHKHDTLTEWRINSSASAYIVTGHTERIWIVEFSAWTWVLTKWLISPASVMGLYSSPSQNSLFTLLSWLYWVLYTELFITNGGGSHSAR